MNPETIEVPVFYFGQIDKKSGWSVGAIRHGDGSLSGHVFSSRGEHFRFIGFGSGGKGTVEAVSMPIASDFQARCLGGNLTREEMYSSKSTKPDVREYDLLFDADYSFYAGFMKKQATDVPSSKRDVYSQQGVLNEMFLAYIEIATVNLRDTLILCRLKTLVLRTDETGNPYNSTEALKKSQVAMWGETHSKGIVLSLKWGTANAGRGAFACQIRRLTTSTYLHEHEHCLGPQHNISGTPEQYDFMTGCHGYSIRRVAAPTVKVIRTACNESNGFRPIPPVELGLPPYAALDLASVRRGHKAPLQIDVLANDAVASGEKIELVQVDPKSVRGQPVRMRGEEVEYVAPANWVGLDSFYYIIRVKDRKSDSWLYAKGVVNVDVHSRVERYQAEAVCGKKQKKTSPPRSGPHEGGYALLDEAQPDPLAWKVNIHKKGYYGLSIRYQEAKIKKGKERVAAELELVAAGQTIRLKAPPQETAQYNDTQWGALQVAGFEWPPGKNKVELRLISGAIRIDSIDLEEGLNIRISFEKGEEPPLSEAYFFVDKGAAHGPQPSSGGMLTYGWSKAKTGLVSDRPNDGMARNRLLDTSIPIGKDTWSIDLPNGKYHLSIFCGDSYNRRKQINNLLVNNKLISDKDGSIYADAVGKPILDLHGEQIMDAVDYYSGVIPVSKGSIIIGQGRGAKEPSLSYIEISRLPDI
ncbi:MAG: hypothetical protein K9M45_09765 [Kiritimatiellales bacterium]|nr:hypothetical protein [Kiritimatiellales bacterium]